MMSFYITTKEDEVTLIPSETNQVCLKQGDSLDFHVVLLPNRGGGLCITFIPFIFFFLQFLLSGSIYHKMVSIHPIFPSSIKSCQYSIKKARKHDKLPRSSDQTGPLVLITKYPKSQISIFDTKRSLPRRFVVIGYDK